MAILDICSNPLKVSNEFTKSEKSERTLKDILWPIKNFQKYFMTHQYKLKIFHDPCKNPPAPSPIYLVYGFLAMLDCFLISFARERSHGKKQRQTKMQFYKKTFSYKSGVLF